MPKTEREITIQHWHVDTYIFIDDGYVDARSFAHAEQMKMNVDETNKKNTTSETES